MCSRVHCMVRTGGWGCAPVWRVQRCALRDEGAPPVCAAVSATRRTAGPLALLHDTELLATMVSISTLVALTTVCRHLQRSAG